MDEATARIEQKLANYTPSISAVNLVQLTPILLLAGISGAGKDSIKAELLKTGKYHRIVSHTTRAPRIERGRPERHGIDYHFIDLVEAERMLDYRAFVESKLYSGNVYGTSVAEIRFVNRKGKAAIADVEVQGAGEYVSIDPTVRVAFILPSDYATWQQRLAVRNGGKLDKEVLTRRMQTALRELAQALDSAYMKFVVNHSLIEAAAETDSIMRGTPSINKNKARRVAEEIYRKLRKRYG